MASLQCIKCRAGIHYHGEPKGIEYRFIKLEDWDSIITSHFDYKNKQYVKDGLSPMLYQTDTIEIDFDDLIVKAWKCPECGAFLFYDENGKVIRVYEEDVSEEKEKGEVSCNYVVFDDYYWDTLTESAVPNCKIPEHFTSLRYAKLNDFKLAFTAMEGETLKEYKRFEFQPKL